MAHVDPEKITRNVGRRIAELRRNLGWTQEQAAARAGVSTKYLQRVEGGTVNLTLHSLVKFANLFRVSPAELFAKPTKNR